ncbi:MAG: methyltransferase domain-containing protein, partial [Rhodospirillaceae bacterium]|nr:methyltransferase domain-containing protein [Rhodospirillaceae bacterium]
MFQTLAEAPAGVLEMVGDSLENRAKDPAQQAILERYIGDLDINPGAVVVEIGCGTGPVCRRFAEIENVARVVGVEPASALVERAGTLADSDKLEFRVGRGEETGLADGSADIVVLHTLLSHVPDQSAILDEAQWRVSKQKTGMTSEFTARVQNDEDARVQNITYKLNVERIQAIFLHYPEVKQAYADYVPDKMTEEQFWSQYFRSAWFYRDRGLSAGADRDIGAGVTDMFSAYETEATARLPGDDGSRHLERRVNPLVDLTATDGDAQRTRGIAHVEQLQRAAALASTKAMAAAAHAARGRTGGGGGGTAGASATSGAAATSSKGEMVIAAYNRHSFLRVEGTADAESRMA